MTMKITRRRALAGVAGGAIAVPTLSALARAAPLPDALDSTLADLWQEWERLGRAASDAITAEDAAAEAIPKWARTTRRDIARLKLELGCEGCDEKAQREAIDSLKTPKYVRAVAKYEAAEKQHDALVDAQFEIERRITGSQGHTISDVLVKTRLADFLVRMNHTRYGALDEDTLENEERLILSVYADLERLEPLVEA